MLNKVINADNKLRNNTLSGIIFILANLPLSIILILIVETRRARVWLVDVEEEHKDRQKVVPERKKTA